MRTIRAICLGLTFLAAFACATSVAAAEPEPGEAGWLYDPGKIVAIDLTLSPAAEAELESEPDEYVEGGIAISTTDGVPGGEEHLIASRNPVGIRLKGSAKGSFRPLSGKAAFKIKFKQFPGGSKFDGLKKLTLNNMVEDFSLIHETLAYTAYRGVGLAASRTGYAFVRVNGEPFGLYLDIEDMDDVALERWFGKFEEPPQHLYEGESGADVVPGVDALPAGEGGFEVDEGDPSNLDDLKALVAAVNSTEGQGWSAAVAPVADLAELTRIWAVEKYIGHWDGYAGQAGKFQPNNYFLYSDPTGVFQMLPWGADETFERRLAFDGPAGLMFDKCLADPACEALYRKELKGVRGTIEGLGLPGLAAGTAAFIEPWWEADPRLEQPDQVAEAGEDAEAFLAARGAEVDAWLGEDEEPPSGEAAPVEPASPLAVPLPTSSSSATLSFAGQDRSGRYLNVHLRLPRTGKVTLQASTKGRSGQKLVCAGSAEATEAGELGIHCRLSRAALSDLGRHALRLELAITMTPAGGLEETIVRSIRLAREPRFAD
jgi:CotH kinase protein